jgi:hypothetical protein
LGIVAFQEDLPAGDGAAGGGLWLEPPPATDRDAAQYIVARYSCYR